MYTHTHTHTQLNLHMNGRMIDVHTHTHTHTHTQLNNGVPPSVNQAYHLLAPLLGTKAASFLFGIALLASGQNSTLTGMYTHTHTHTRTHT